MEYQIYSEKKNKIAFITQTQHVTNVKLKVQRHKRKSKLTLWAVTVAISLIGNYSIIG